MTMILDASPFGLGGVLVQGDRIVSWFPSALTVHDEKQFGRKTGSYSGQQVWEALCIRVALRAWSRHWISQQTSLTINSDIISSLVMASRLKVTSSQLIARE